VSRQNIFMSFVSKSRSNNRSYNGITSKKAIKQMTQYTIDQVINQLSNADDLWIHSFKQLEHCIYDYFQNIESWTSHDIKNNTIWIEVFDFAYLDNDNRVIICASLNYHNQAAFSNVCIEMDELEQDDYLTDYGSCYAKILLIIRITSPKLDQKLELALVH
ncbi:11778_t:CDS:2, partial [Scutellospora calospora]